MIKEQAVALLLALGSKHSATTAEWVQGRCPLAPWLHKSGKDSRPSFGLSISPGRACHFHCFACQSGDMPMLMQLIEHHVVLSPGLFKGNLAAARSIIELEEVGLPVLPAYEEFNKGDQKTFVELPLHTLAGFQVVSMWPRAMEYLVSRGFTALDWVNGDLRYDSEDDRIVFPYYDVFGRLAGMRGRGVELPGEKPHWAPHHDYVWSGVNNSSLVWLGEPILDTPGPVVIVEGQFDRLRALKAYPRVLANLTAKPKMSKAIKLAGVEGVILMLDGDEAGRTGTKMFTEALDLLKVPTAVVLLPMVDQDGNPCKSDPDKLGVEWITQALKDVGVLD